MDRRIRRNSSAKIKHYSRESKFDMNENSICCFDNYVMEVFLWNNRFTDFFVCFTVSYQTDTRPGECREIFIYYLTDWQLMCILVSSFHCNHGAHVIISFQSENTNGRNSKTSILGNVVCVNCGSMCILYFYLIS